MVTVCKNKRVNVFPALQVHRSRLGSEEDEGPLAHPKILVKILNYCNLTFIELKSVRLVSRLWHEVTLDRWRRLATLKLIQDVPSPPEPCSSATVLSPIYQSKELSGAPMSMFLLSIVDPSDPYDLSSRPFKRVKLKGIDVEQEMEFTGDNTEIINVFPRIWSLIGVHVKYLHCEECMFENTLYMGAFQKLVLEMSPKLQQLVMTNTIVLSPTWEQNPHLIIRYECNLKFNTLHIRGDFPMGLSNFLPYIPNIEELKIRHGTTLTSLDRHSFSSVWTPFSNLRKLNKDNFNLKRLDVMHTDTFKIPFNPTNQFRTTDLPLKVFSVEIRPYLNVGNTTPPIPSSSRASTRLRSTEDILAPMLREHVETLGVFKVFRAPFSPPYSNFPFGILMEGMKELLIWGNITNNLNFLKCMPNLEVLFVNTTCFEKREEMKNLFEYGFPYEYQPFQEDIVRHTGSFHSNFTLQMESMRELHLELIIAPESISQLANWMPNLRVFRCIMDKGSFRTVCSTMSKLEELGILFGSEVDNDTITGVAPGIPRDPRNITTFKGLKRFQFDAYCGKSLLKDGAVYLAFLTMRLYKLEICVSRQMSKKAEEEVKAAVPIVRFIRNYGPEPHEGYDCCKRVRFERDVTRRLRSHQTATERVFNM